MCLGNLKNFELKKKKQSLKSESQVKKYVLNYEQKNALENLTSLGNKFNVSVLQGITGSGKTLVYFERINRLIKENKQALILIPEIFLTTQFKNRFKLFFGFEPAIWHSKISINKKKDIYLSLNDSFNNNNQL